MAAHAAVRCNIVISGTCQSYNKVVSEEYLGTTMPGNGCWSDKPHYSGGLGMTAQAISTFALRKVAFPMNIFHFSFKWVHIYTCTHKPLHNSGLKGPLEAQDPTQSSTHSDQVLCLSAPHQVLLWTGITTGKAERLLFAMHHKKENKALYVVVARV